MGFYSLARGGHCFGNPIRSNFVEGDFSGLCAYYLQ